MHYRVVLIQTDEGYAVGCPALPGCWTQGGTREEALANICEAIREVVEVKEELELEKWRADGFHIETEHVDVMVHA